MKQNKAAIFYDAENFSNEKDAYRIINSVIKETQNERIIFNGAYADWGLQKNENREIFIANGIALKQSISYQKVGDTFKNASDISLCIDAIEVILKNKDLNKIIIVSGDGGFINLIIKAKELGVEVVVISVLSKVNKSVKQYADKLITIDLTYSPLQNTVWSLCKQHHKESTELLLKKILSNGFVKTNIYQNQFIIDDIIGTISKAIHKNIGDKIKELIYKLPYTNHRFNICNIEGKDILLKHKHP